MAFARDKHSNHRANSIGNYAILVNRDLKMFLFLKYTVFLKKIYEARQWWFLSI